MELEVGINEPLLASKDASGKTYETGDEADTRYKTKWKIISY
jgi:hypothetical protein